MPTPPSTLTGHCMCGAVTYSVTAEPGIVAVCNCIDCQHQTGSAHSVVFGVPASELSVEGDSLKMYATKAEDSGVATERNFCSGCGSPIVTYSAAYPGMAFIKAGTLDDTSWIEPKVEIWCGSKPAWSPDFPDAHHFERDPVAL